MDSNLIMKSIGMVASLTLPLFNIPLIYKIKKTKSSKDLSLIWAIGVWFCIVLMLPAALISKDLIFKVFSSVNFIFFSMVLIYIIKYRK